MSDGAFFYVMELLDGLDADSLLRRFGPIPSDRAIYLLRQICHSLSEAAWWGVVHRDIKPANIFLCRYEEEYDFVKVLDFRYRESGHRFPGHRAGAHAGERGAGDTGIHCSRAGAGVRRGWPGRYLCYRVCGLLAPDRAVRVLRRHSDGSPELALG